MKGIIDWIVDFAKISWEIFCMIPITCIVLVVAVIILIPVMRDTQKSIDKAHGPIIFW